MGLKRKDNLLGWLCVAPLVAIMGIFVVYPAIRSFYLSFHEFTGSGEEVYAVGLDHYRELIASDEYRHSLKVTLQFVLYTVPTSVVLSLIIALGLDAQPLMRRGLRAIFLLPVAVSTAMAAMLWIFIFNPTAGYLNYVLGLFDIQGPSWLPDPAWALLSVSIATVWKEIGFNIIFFMAALTAIPVDLLDAAKIDGASTWKTFWRVKIPLISPTLFFVSIVSMIHAFESFGQIHILTRGGPADATNVLVYFLYRSAFEHFRMGFASAQATVLFAIILMATMIQFRVAQKRVHYQ